MRVMNVVLDTGTRYRIESFDTVSKCLTSDITSNYELSNVRHNIDLSKFRYNIKIPKIRYNIELSNVFCPSSSPVAASWRNLPGFRRSSFSRALIKVCCFDGERFFSTKLCEGDFFSPPMAILLPASADGGYQKPGRNFHPKPSPKRASHAHKVRSPPSGL